MSKKACNISINNIFCIELLWQSEHVGIWLFRQTVALKKIEVITGLILM